MKIFFTGYRCTGKTTTGKLLADLIGFSFMDTDQMVEQQEKLSISQIVETYGWNRFREIEKQILMDTEQYEKKVISTGGGIVTDRDNLEFIRKNGFTVWLDADSSIIINRLKNDEKSFLLRPSLTENNLVDETNRLLKEREHLYAECSNMKIDTTDKTPEKIVQIIYRSIKTDVRQHNR